MSAFEDLERVLRELIRRLSVQQDRCQTEVETVIRDAIRELETQLDQLQMKALCHQDPSLGPDSLVPSKTQE